MSRKQRSELTAGLFTIGAIILLVGVVFWLGAADVFKPRGQKTYFYVDQSSGRLALKSGGQVLINDVVVGKITDVEFDPTAGKDGQTFYIVQIHRRDIKVHSDGEAKVAAALVGGANLVITNRGSDGEPLADNRDNAIGILPSAFEQAISGLAGELDHSSEGSMMWKFHGVVDELSRAMVNASEALASLKKEMDTANKVAVLAKLHEIIDSISRIASDAQPKLKNTLTDIEAMMADAKPKVSKALNDAGEVAAEINRMTKKEIADILVQVRKANTDLLVITGNFAKVSEETKRLVDVNRENLDEMVDNMVVVSANLKTASKEIRRSPWRLLYQPKKGELHSQNIYDAARAFSSGAAQMDQTLAKLSGLARAYPRGLPVDDPQLEQIRKQIKEIFTKFNKAEQALWKEFGK
ncbi:MAG: hypothetical protein QF792_00390 [Phycisphaerae bacterium]|jgi:ABC-type transporter Mla subunit MlaD|nr:hypothetical protein [Phycisphaerae bacterium]